MHRNTGSAHRRRVTVRKDNAMAMQPSKPPQIPVTGVPKVGCTAVMAPAPVTMAAVDWRGTMVCCACYQYKSTSMEDTCVLLSKADGASMSDWSGLMPGLQLALVKALAGRAG
jgi:hypothetical protein